ncbi:M28 family peptidase, partial [Allopontixanthobacter sp.]|uniref:M28 family peptidase n=1 Tax=Allopontixanthobacter sp. TaxID=2906452 RepID=UPI002ABC8F7D
EQRDALLDRGASAVLAILASDSALSAIAAQRQAGSHRLAEDGDGSRLDGYMTPGAAQALLGAGRMDRLLESAELPDFKPVPLPLSVSIEATATLKEVQTHNLIARLPGTRPELGAVLLAAHWDHFGICGAPPAQDLICNGAVDNASGLAVLTEIARRLAAGPRLERDVYFLATTAEEWGLLGARAFADNPPIPLPTFVAAFNIDSIAIAPRGAPVVIVGAGLTPLDEPTRRIIAAQGRKPGDEGLAASYLRRQDGWVLLQRDVPTLMVSSAFADRALLEPYTTDRYHLPSDRFEGIELGGAAQDLLLHLDLVRFFADSGTYPPPAPTGN